MFNRNRVRHSWERAPLPEDCRGPGLMLGWIAIGIGSLLIYTGSTYPEGIALVGPALGIAGVGVLSIMISLVLREIRRVAFDAALRAGEVETEH